MDALFVPIGFASLLLIVAYPIGSSFLAGAWLRDVHWERSFAHLGEDLFRSLREADGPLQGWEKGVLRTLTVGRDLPVHRSDEGVIRAVGLLTGGLRTSSERDKMLALRDILLYRAVLRVLDEVSDAPYDRDLARRWLRARARRDGTIVATSRSTFLRMWSRHTAVLVGTISAVALFLGTFFGLAWWVVQAMINGGAGPEITADWTGLTGAVVTFATVVSVAAALTWRLVRALVAVYPGPARMIRKLVLWVGALALLALTAQFTFAFLHYDPNTWEDADPSVSRVASSLFLVTVLGAVLYGCIRYAVRPRTRAGVQKSMSLRVFALTGVSYAGAGLVAVLAAAVPPVAWLAAVVGWLLVVLLLGTVVSGVAAGSVYLHERFARWRALADDGVVIGRLGFREWQAWAWLGIAGAPLLAEWLLAALGVKGDSAVALYVSVGAVLLAAAAILWFVVFGVLGLVFLVRVNVAYSRAHPPAPADAPVVMVSYDRLVHEAFVEHPLGVLQHGAQRFLVEDPRQPGTLRVAARDAGERGAEPSAT